MSGVGCPAPWPTETIYRTSSPEGRDVGVVFRDDVLSNKISFQDVDGKGFIEHLRSTHGDTRRHVHRHGDGRGNVRAPHRAVGPAVSRERRTRPSRRTPTSCSRDRWPTSTRTLLATLPPQESRETIVPVTISELFGRLRTGRRRSSRGPRRGARRTTTSTTAFRIRCGRRRATTSTSCSGSTSPSRTNSYEKAQEVADTAVSKRHAEIARGLLDPALHSCQFWWASRRPHWDVNMISRGMAQQGEVVLNAFRSINLSDAPRGGEARRVLQGGRRARHPRQAARSVVLGLTAARTSSRRRLSLDL